MNRALDFRHRGFIAPHRVYCNGDHLAGDCVRQLLRCGLNHFTAFVLAAVRADAVWNFRFMAVRALGVRRPAEGIMSAAGLCARVGVSSFRIRHGFS
jgi:hypothetical protein